LAGEEMIEAEETPKMYNNVHEDVRPLNLCPEWGTFAFAIGNFILRFHHLSGDFACIWCPDDRIIRAK